ncbi:uncharacterized protein [Prorops nasuta]|uniref:uncharacterized protein n=1 Tax=Prorops nasuta TaxID=863751 RepID=UPI0034CE33DB
MISELNADQKRVFDKVTEALTSKNNILRLYVSGEGGTGKSFLIKTIRCWTKQVLGKDTAVTAPTGIAAFNIDGLTIHRLFQLPVEHGHTAKYSDLSDQVLKIVRNELKNVTLIIIDEVSMISNIIFMYIHLRLTAIFNTEDCEDGWFGNKHILLFGDLLQLPPVHEDPAFIKLSNDKILNHIGAIGTADLWAALFTYDELRINMRQKGDLSYKDVLSRIRVGIVLDKDTAILASRMIKLNDSDYNVRIYELCDYISQLPTDAVCLFATCEKCDFLNTTMLKDISSEEIKLIAKDSVDCPSYLRKKTEQVLIQNDETDEDSTRTAGLARVITVKIGAKIMIRRNIDVSLGLVNGTMATVVSVKRSIDNNQKDVESINVRLSDGVEHTIERLSAKFEIMDRVYVIR